MKISPKFLIIFTHLILIFLFVSLCLWGLWDVPLLSVNEARRAVTVREMFTSQHWLLPTLNGELYLAKPPLFYWLALIPAHLIGSASELAVRLPSAVLALCCFASIFIAGSRIVGRSGSIFAVVFLGANAGFTMFARRAEIEMTLTGFCLMSLLAAWPFLFRGGSRHWLILSYALLGCAFLTKGPVCLLYITLPIFVFSRWHDNARTKEFLRDPVGWIIAGVIGFSWYAAVTAQLGMDVWKNIFQRDIIGKMVGGSREPWHAYIAYLAGDFFPFWLILFVKPRDLWRRLSAYPELQLVLCAALIPLIIFSLFNDKHAKYLLPAYPFFSLLLGYRWAQIVDVASAHTRMLLRITPFVFLAGFTVYYAVYEEKLFSYRVSALPSIKNVFTAQIGRPVYTLTPPDMRLVYYAGRQIRQLTPRQLAAVEDQQALLFVESALPADFLGASSCVIDSFKPYLKINKEAFLIDAGSTCKKLYDPAIFRYSTQ